MRVLQVLLQVDARGAAEDGGASYLIGGGAQLQGAEIETVRRYLRRGSNAGRALRCLCSSLLRNSRG